MFYSKSPDISDVSYVTARFIRKSLLFKLLIQHSFISGTVLQYKYYALEIISSVAKPKWGSIIQNYGNVWYLKINFNNLIILRKI